MKTNGPIKTLDSEIEYVQIDHFINKFDKTTNKELKNKFKTAAIIIVPFIISTIGFAIFTNIAIIAVGAAYAFSAIIVYDQIKRKRNEKKNDPVEASIVSIVPKEEASDEVLGMGVVTKKGSDYYTEEYKEALRLKKTEDTQITKPRLEILGDYSLSKEETIEQISREIDLYYGAYKLPPFKVERSELDNYYDCCYKLFERKGLEETFYDSMSDIVRLSLAKALTNNSASIKVSDFVSNLKHLNHSKFETEEILKTQKEIHESISMPNVININDYNDLSKRSL